MSGRIEVALQVGERVQAGARKASPDDPFRILLMGEFSGRCRRLTGEAAVDHKSRLMRLDIDNLDQVLATLRPMVTLPARDHRPEDLAIDFACLDDFHPDALYRRLPYFRRLGELREQLLDPAAFSQAVAELSSEIQVLTSAAAVEQPAAEGKDGQESDAEMVERLLGTRPERTRSPAGRAQVLDLLKSAVASSFAADLPHQALYLKALDQLLGARMRDILHDPGFQALEAAWRSAHRVVSSLETGEDLQVWLLDLSRDDLQIDLTAAGSDPSLSELCRLLMETGPDAAEGSPWSLLVGNYTFGVSPEDTSALAALGEVASRGGGAFLAAADPGILGCASLADAPNPSDWKPIDPPSLERWQGLRRGAAARSVGLALPRVLLRLPYGSATDPVDSFEFEEMGKVREHNLYLWGNPAFVCASLIGKAFVRSGWGMRPGDVADMDDLPAHVYTDDGEPMLQACAEVYLTESAAKAIASLGLMPLLSYRNRNAIRVWDFCSLADAV